MPLIQSFLTNRTQSVQINGTVSNPLPIRTGTPQGSVLGPTLFLIYLNALHFQNQDKDVKITSFADDTAIIVTESSWTKAVGKLELCLQSCQNYLSAYKLKLNEQKSKFITFSSSSRSQPKSLTIRIHKSNCRETTCNFKVLQQAKNVKYLGLILDQHMKWNLHMEYLTNKLRKLQYGFKIIAGICNKENALKMYVSLVQSLLLYGILLWGGSYQSNQIHLARTQKRILKIILRKPQSYSTQLTLTETNTLTINQLLTLEICKYVHKNKSILNPPDHSYPTRLNTRLSTKTTKCNKTASQNYFTYKLIKIYNNLPEHIKHINKFKTYSKSVKEWIRFNV